MNCVSCGRMNLPGGVRCIYCGTPFPPAIDFDLGEQAAAGTQSPTSTLKAGSAQQSGRASKARGLAGALALLALKGKSLLSLLSLGKIAVTLASMAVFIRIYSWWFGWMLAIGFTLSIFVHEMGHVVVGWRKGIKQTAPMFIPFLGAVIQVKEFPNDPTAESEMGAGGPVAGGLAGLVCLFVAHHTGSPLWLMLALLVLGINLINLFPFEPLDGSHIAAAFSPQIWSAVLIGLLLWVLKVPSLAVWLILMIGFLFRLGHDDNGRHLLTAPIVRVRMAVIYLLLCVILGWGIQDSVTTLSQRGYTRSAALSAARSGQSAPAARSQPAQGVGDRVSGAGETGHVTPLSERPVVSLSPQLLWVFRILLFLLAALLWFFTAALLASASGQQVKARSLSLVPWMIAALAVVYAGFTLTGLPAVERWILLGAYFAATFAALVYAGYQAAHLRTRRVRPDYSALLARCLAWACAGALLVAYAANNLIVAGVVIVCAIIFYLRAPWMLFSLAGSLAESIGDHERSIALRQRAITLKPDTQANAHLWAHIARLNLLLDRGGPAIEALQSSEALRASNQTSPASYQGMTANLAPSPYEGEGRGGVAVSPSPSLPLSPSAGESWGGIARLISPPGQMRDARPLSIAELEQRATAWMLLDRYDEALACCERILQAPPDDPRSAWRLFAVHLRLARIARFRGWIDEAQAQTEWCLRAAPKQAKPLLARLHTMRAEALGVQGQHKAALTACDEALALSRETYVQAWVAVIRAQAYLLARRFEEADRETTRAVRLLPGHLEFRYWRGRTLAEIGTGEAGQALLSDLASAFPNEHWGRLALVAARPAPAPSKLGAYA